MFRSARTATRAVNTGYHWFQKNQRGRGPAAYLSDPDDVKKFNPFRLDLSCDDRMTSRIITLADRVIFRAILGMV